MSLGRNAQVHGIVAQKLAASVFCPRATSHVRQKSKSALQDMICIIIVTPGFCRLQSSTAMHHRCVPSEFIHTHACRSLRQGVQVRHELRRLAAQEGRRVALVERAEVAAAFVDVALGVPRLVDLAVEADLNSGPAFNASASCGPVRRLRGGHTWISM
jgi:hypothetical protein